MLPRARWRCIATFLSESDAEYWCISPDIPELTIGVATPWRGHGIGRALLPPSPTRTGTRGSRRSAQRRTEELRGPSSQTFEAQLLGIATRNDQLDETVRVTAALSG